MYDEDIDHPDAIKTFFEDPREDLHSPGEFGTLYLLRRDALRCFGCKLDYIQGDLACAASVYGNMQEGVLFPGVMVVLAGIDLLGKFWAGSEKPGTVGQRFKGYITEFFSNCADEESHVLWTFRNALMHSFGLWGTTNGDPVLFDLRFTGGLIVERLDGLQTYAIDALTLHREFETSVVRYREAVDTNETARTNFEKMYSHYGQVAFTGELLEPRALFGPYSFSQYHRFEHEMR